ncbi:menaquinone biosynthesis decarboxylase, SCO4490 family, partial [Chlamydia psittaci 06-1683]
LKKLKLMRKR